MSNEMWRNSFIQIIKATYVSRKNSEQNLVLQMVNKQKNKHACNPYETFFKWLHPNKC